MNNIRAGIVTLVAAMMIAAGCNAPVKNRAANPSNSNRVANSRGPSRPSAFGDSDAARVSQLVVNGEVVTVDDILSPIREDLAERYQRLSQADYRRYVAQMALRQTRDKVVDIVLYQKASLRLTPAEEEALEGMVTTEMRKRVTEVGNGTQHEYEKILAASGTTLEQERERFRRQLIVHRYLQLNVLPKVQEPTRAELTAIFEANKKAMSRPQRRRMSLIEVRLLNHLDAAVDAVSRDQQKEASASAREIIDQAYQEISGGRDFADAARQFSEGINAENGGDWGWVWRDTVRARWKPAVERLYTLDRGRVSEVLETGEGFFLVRCDEIQEAVVPDFESVQPQLIERHRTGAYNELINELIESLIKKARIEPPDIQPFVAAVVDAAPPHASGAVLP